MSEPQRTEPADPGATSEAERAARIEQLLLTGLDHYFGGNYEQAINVWTRVAFLERGHGRARAYIERARSAVAERQRESEESLHRGIAAYDAGDLRAARELLTRAVEQGGPNETALLFLQRLGHFDAASERPRGQASPSRAAQRRSPAEASARRKGLLGTVLASAAIASAIVLGAMRTASWLRESPIESRTGDPLRAEPLPVLRTPELRLARARDLYQAGRALDALRELDSVDAGDPVRADADRLRSDIQRALLSAMSRGTAASGEPRR